MPERESLLSLDKEILIDMLEDQAKNWLAHDGLWFQKVERRFGIQTAIELDTEAWIEFTQIEGRRIMKRHGIKLGGGLEALRVALGFRLYARINEQSIHYIDERNLRFEMNECRVQTARKRKGLADFPCKGPGLAEYAYFANTIDPRIRTRVIACPPDPHPDSYYCAWQFTLEDDVVPQDQLLGEGYQNLLLE
ncbi:MAG: DUF6125 family protein [Anaerolineales bacterium]